MEVKNLLQLLKQNKVPNRRTLFSKEIIPKKISEFLDNCVELLIEVPSVADHSQHCKEVIKNPTTSHFKESPCLLPSLCNDIVHPIFTLKDLKECAASLKDVICRGYHLSRRKAKELFVCLLSSANRLYNPELPLYFSIFYGKKGKTFSSEEKRQVYDTVMDACVERDINVLATSFDGECFSLITEDNEGNPLTVIQLQHQVFSEVKKLDKKQIVRNIVQHSRAAVTKEKLSVSMNHI